MTPETEALIARVLAHDDRTAAPKLARMLAMALDGLRLDETRGDTEETLMRIEEIAREGA